MFAEYEINLMPNTFRLAACLLLLSAFGLPSAALSKPQLNKPRMTKYQVIQTFQRFSLQVAGDRRAEAFITRPDQAPLTTITYYDADYLPKDPLQRSMIVSADHPRGFWKIEAQRSFAMEVDDQTGNILSYSDDAASEDGKYKAAGKAMPKEEARTRAEAALSAAGVSLEHLQLSYIQQRQGMHGTDTTPLSRQTRVVWDCAWQYLSGKYDVWIDTQTGAVIGGEHIGSL